MLAGILPGFVADLFDQVDRLINELNDLASEPWFLAVIFVIALLDSIIPIVPSETTVIVGGVAAGLGQQPLWAVILCGAAGAFVGDNIAYTIGSRLSGWFRRRAEHNPKREARLTWATTQIRRRGGLLLITARFIPGGRTVLTLSCGITHQPRKWFVFWTAVASVIWASYAASLGYFGGKVFADNHTAAFLVAFGTAIGITVVIEVARHFWGHANDELIAEIAAAELTIDSSVDDPA